MERIQWTTDWLGSADELVDLARRIESRIIDHPPAMHLSAEGERLYYYRLQRMVGQAQQLLGDITPEELQEAMEAERESMR